MWSIEGGLAEDDRAGSRELTARLRDRVKLVGDDNFVTNPAIIASAIEEGIAYAALIKLNQIGTVTETLEAMRVCREGGYGQMVSHRSGETPVRPSRTSPSGPGAGRSSPARWRGVNALPSTTCSAHKPMIVAWTRACVSSGLLLEGGSLSCLFALVYLLLRRVIRWMAGPSNDRMDTEVEVVVLRHQLMVLKRQLGKPTLRRRDRFSWQR